MANVSPESEKTFFLLRPSVSSLLSTATINATNASDVAGNLRSIHLVVMRMSDPELHLTTALIRYIHQALIHVLTICDKFLAPQTRFDYVIEPWCDCLAFLLQLSDAYNVVVASGMPYIRFLMTSMLVVVNVSPITVNQQQQQQQQQPQQQQASILTRKTSDEARLASLRCLILLLPLDRHSPQIQDQIREDVNGHGGHQRDWESVVQFKDDRKFRTEADNVVAQYLKGAENKVIFAKIFSVLLETVANADLISLRITALEGCMKLFRLFSDTDMITTLLPGIMAKLMAATLARGLKENNAVLTRILEIFAYIIIAVFGDQDRASNSTSIDNNSDSTLSTGETLMKMFKEKQTSSSLKPRVEDTVGSPAWYTMSFKRLKVVFRELANIRRHPHWKVRLVFSQLSFRVLRECRDVISRYGNDHSNGVAGFLLETIVGYSQDEYKEVFEPSTLYLSQLSEEFRSFGLSNVAKGIMREKLLALPRVLHGPDESRKQEAIKLALGLALFLGPEMERLIDHQNLWSYIQAWTNILTIEQLDHHNIDERGGILGIGSKDTGAAQTAEEERWNIWIKQANQSTSPVSYRKHGFPRKIMLHLREQETSTSFLAFLRQLGSATEITTWSEELLSRLQQETRAVRENQGWFDSRSVSTVVLMNQLLLGASRIGILPLTATLTPASTKVAKKTRSSKKEKPSSRRKQQQHVRRVARGVLEEYLAILVESSSLATDAKSQYEAEKGSQSEAHYDDHKKKSSLQQFLTIDQGEVIDFDTQSNKIYDFNADVMLKSVLLEGIASIAVLLGGTEFEMELVRVLYVLLEQLGDQDSALIRDTAQATLEHVAFVCQYNTIGDLIQANYDYVIQQISQRIAFLSTNPKSPQVLWALIHVVGPPAVSMLEDSVTEIFEALDHWKNQEDEVAEGLLKSLKEIVNVMAIAATTIDDSPKKPEDSKRDSGVQLIPGIEISLPNKPSKEVAEFAKGYRLLTKGIDLSDAEDDKFKKEVAGMTPDQIKEYFLQREKEIKDEEERRLGKQGQEFHDDHKNTDEKDINEEDPISFGDLHAKMPKPSKESQPAPPTKHQSLCLRILNKAGYFLTATSPRMRIIALEIIQGSIVVLKDRPQELNPAIYELWPSIVRRILKRSELEVFYVTLRAIEIVTLLAENCSAFLTRHLLDDVWPFILRALRTWTKAPPQTIKDHASRTLGTTTVYSNSSGSNTMKVLGSKSSAHPQRSPVIPTKRRQATKVMTREHRFQLTTLESISKIVRKISIPVQELWEMLLLARDLVQDQYWMLHKDVRLAAVRVIKDMALAGNGDAVWLAINDAVEGIDTHHELADSNFAEDDEATKEMFTSILDFVEDHNL
ncbi:TEL2-interacting protein 1 [Podila humilis]|nr:TEL2-interacting protein 1 [Podila humilis]